MAGRGLVSVVAGRVLASVAEGQVLSSGMAGRVLASVHPLCCSLFQLFHQG